MQAVSGVASNSPMGPQSHVQKEIAINMASLDVPAFWLKSMGSTIIPTTGSSTAKSAKTDSGCHQLEDVARLTANASKPAIQIPTYGTKRRTTIKHPHNSEYGTPSSSN